MKQGDDQTAFNFNNDLPRDLDGGARTIAVLIGNRRGRERAIGRRELVAISGIDDREIRNIVASLITQHHLPIGSSSKGGYYWIESIDDLVAEAARLLAYIRSLADRKRALEKIARERFGAGDLFGQIGADG